MLLILVSFASALSQSIDTGFANVEVALRREGIRVDDQAALLATLNRRDRPGLAALAAQALRRLPKNDLVMRELRAAAATGPEGLMRSAIESLAVFGDTSSWIGIARAQLPKMKQPANSLTIAWLLARSGYFDGWETAARHIVSQNPFTRDSARLTVDAFIDMKDASGRPVDVVKKLEEIRSSTSSKAVQDEITAKIDEINRVRRKRAEGGQRP